MYGQLPSDLSYAQRMLIDTLHQRRFMKFLRSVQIPETLIPNIYFDAIGTMSPSYTHIFLLRTLIPPCYWFFTESETKPEPIPFHVIYTEPHNEAEYTLAARAMIQKLKKRRRFHPFLHQQELSKQAYTAIVNMTNIEEKAGCRLWRQHPTFHAVRALKHAIHPDYWYIFTDEIQSPLPELTV